MSQQQQQSRTFSTGSNKLPGRGGVLGASTTLSSTILPPRLTGDALTSFHRLDLPTHSFLKWDRYDCSKADVKLIEDLSEELLELRYAEYQACTRNDDQNGDSTLWNTTLWSIERSDERFGGHRGGSQLWVMKLSEKEQTAKALSFASLDDRKHVSSSKEALDRKIGRSGLTRTSGHLQLQDLLSALGKFAQDDPLSLSPLGQYDLLHRNFLQAVEDLLLARWTWSHSMKVLSAKNSEVKPAASGKASRKQADDNDEEHDEEEEGAIKDAVEQDRTPHASESRYWLRAESAPKLLSRFRGGALLQHTSPSTMDIYSETVNPLLHVTLHCTLDENGHLYVITRPQDLCSLQCAQDIPLKGSAERSAGIIAPDGTPVRLIQQVPGLEWPQQDAYAIVLDEKSRADECMLELRKMLLLRGVDVAQLDDRWILCETVDNVQFLWPAMLCLSTRPQEQRARDKNEIKFLSKPLQDLAERAQRLVKESIGIPLKEEAEDSIMKDEEDDLGGTVGAPGDVLQEAMAEDAEMDSQGSRDEGEADDERQKSAKTDQKNPNLVNAGDSKEGIPFVKEETTLAADQVHNDNKGSISPPSLSKANGLSRYDDETDLWGTFGFGAEDNETKRSMRRQSGVGMDEAGFGLITEDDFSFFDDSNQGGGVFDDMDVDLQSQEELLKSIGNTSTERPLEMDNVSEMAMTNSTFVDPPSLPGFTPGSFSATSPAVGGLNAKTPRTPYSPSQDMMDANITIEGESDSLRYDRHHFPHDPDVIQHEMSRENLADLTRHNRVKADQINNENINGNQKTEGFARNRIDLSSKYEQGKYAMLNAPANRSITKSDKADTNQEVKNMPRDRLRNRNSHVRRPSGGSGTRGMGIPSLRRLALPSPFVRPEEDGSDVDATIDGTMSERSSLMDHNSDNEDSSISGDTSEEDVMASEARLKYLQSSIQKLQSGVLSDEIASGHADKSDIAENAKHIDLVPFLDMLMTNPQIYLVCSDKSKAKTMARSSTACLFEPIPCRFEQSTLASLLRISPHANDKVVRNEETTPLCIKPLHQPKILVGCRGSVTIMESSALSYWNVAALSAVSGPKQIVALALHCGSLLPSWQMELLDWFTSLKSSFERSGLGSHQLVKDGLLGLGESHGNSVAQILAQTTFETEQWADTLESLLSRLEKDLKRGCSIVVYTINIRINPEYSWIYPRLQNDLRELAWKRLGVAPDLINIWPMAWSSLTSTMQCKPERDIGLLRMALSIYDAIQIPIRPNVNQKGHLPSIPIKPVGVRHPYFTLLPSQPLGRSSTSFQLDRNAEPYNLLDCGMLLHVAYSIGSSPGQFTFVAIIDEKAQGYHMNGWRRQGDLLFELECIWKEAQAYAKRARILWRIVICKEEAMTIPEVQHWSSIMKKSQDASFRALDVTLACLDLLTPMTVILPRQRTADTIETISSTNSTRFEGQRHHFIRADQCDYAIYPPFRIDLGATQTSVKRTRSCILALQSSVTVSLSSQYNGATMQVNVEANSQSTEWTPTAPHHSWLHILQVCNTRYSHTTQDLTMASRIRLVTESFHKLTFVAKEKLLTRDNLPWHITILATARRACHLF